MSFAPAAPVSPVPRIALIHATPLAMAPIDEAMNRLWPQARRMHLLDDSLSADLARDGVLTEAMTNRFLMLARYARDTGAGAILFTCSAFGPAIEAAAAGVGIPALKPNEAMFEQALSEGTRIGLVATFQPSLAPMRAELQAMAAARGATVNLHEAYVPQAMESLARGDSQDHHERIAHAVAGLAHCDLIMLAQFSMAAAAPLSRGRVNVPVLTSPDCAVLALQLESL